MSKWRCNVFKISGEANAPPLVARLAGHIVALDESVVAERNAFSNGQARPVPQQCVFGGVDLETR